MAYRAASSPKNKADLEAAIADGEKSNRFSAESSIGLFEASPSTKFWEDGLNDKDLAKKLDEYAAGQQDTIKTRTFFIAWATNNEQLAITPNMLRRLCTTFYIPLLFVEGLLGVASWIRHGNALFLYQSSNGNSSKLDVFYKYSFESRTGRAYIFTTYNFLTKVTTNICVNLMKDTQFEWVQELGAQVAMTSVEQPLALHYLIESKVLHNWNIDEGKARSELSQDERGDGDPNPKTAAVRLHALSKRFHVLLSKFNDQEERIEFLIRACETFDKVIDSRNRLKDSVKEIYMFKYLLSKCRISKRRILNYIDRTNIRINLAFHLSTQVDNELNVLISKATTAIARDAQRDSSSMITIAAVTMFFLPGTFISAIFSMVFFNISPDPDGNLQFRVSDRWWYFLAATIPTTLAVFMVWIVWQKMRFRNQQKEYDFT